MLYNLTYNVSIQKVQRIPVFSSPSCLLHCPLSHHSITHLYVSVSPHLCLFLSLSLLSLSFSLTHRITLWVRERNTLKIIGNIIRANASLTLKQKLILHLQLMQSTVPLSAQCNQCNRKFKGCQAHYHTVSVGKRLVNMLYWSLFWAMLRHTVVLVKWAQLQSQALMCECRVHAVQFINSSKFLPSCGLHIIDLVRNAELPLCLWHLYWSLGSRCTLLIEGE